MSIALILSLIGFGIVAGFLTVRLMEGTGKNGVIIVCLAVLFATNVVNIVKAKHDAPSCGERS